MGYSELVGVRYVEEEKDQKTSTFLVSSKTSDFINHRSFGRIFVL